MCLCARLSDRCWAAIDINFNAYWAALPTGGCHTLLAGCSCRVREAWNGWQSKKVHGSVMGLENKSVTEGMEKRVGMEV